LALNLGAFAASADTRPFGHGGTVVTTRSGNQKIYRGTHKLFLAGSWGKAFEPDIVWEPPFQNFTCRGSGLNMSLP
jgi:hypothetical protein